MPWKGINDYYGRERILSDCWVSITSDAVGSDMLLCTVYPPEGAEYMWAELRLSDDASFNEFNISVRTHKQGQYVTIASASSDYTTDIQEPILGCSHDFHTMLSDTSGLIRMNVKATESIKFTANTTGGTSLTSDVKSALLWNVR